MWMGKSDVEERRRKRKRHTNGWFWNPL